MGKIAGMKDCVESLAQKRGIPKTEAKSILEDVFEILSDKIVQTGGVSLKDIMTLKQKVQKGRSGTFKGIEWHTPDKVILSVKTGTQMKIRLNPSTECEDCKI